MTFRLFNLVHQAASSLLALPLPLQLARTPRIVSKLLAFIIGHLIEVHSARLNYVNSFP